MVARECLTKIVYGQQEVVPAPAPKNHYIF